MPADPPLLSYVIPTHNRPERLQSTLEALSGIDDHVHRGAAEVIVVDDASDLPPDVPARVGAMPVEYLRRRESIGAACRNDGAAAARGQWIVMLDDDSYPLGGQHAARLAAQPDDVVAVGAEIWLPGGGRESGGLPEVFIGCGVAIRRDAFLAAGGYDASFHYYVEEYDLAARLIQAGGRIIHDRGFQVRHEKVVAGRDMNVILERLVRNNGWVIQRYAPNELREAAMAEMIDRYRAIAEKENAVEGYRRGHAALEATRAEQPVRTMTDQQWDRFIGAAAAQDHLGKTAQLAGARGHVVARGKNDRIIDAILDERADVECVDEVENATHLIIGTLSPGPMLDAAERFAADGRPVVTSWCLEPPLCEAKGDS